METKNSGYSELSDNLFEGKVSPGVTGKKSIPIRVGSLLMFVGTVIFVQIYGVHNQQVSRKYYLYVTPPSYFFIIWALIFGLKAIQNIYNCVKNIWRVQQHIILSINNALLILWTIVFDIGDNISVFSSCLILFALVPIILQFWRQIGQIRPINWFTYLTRNTYAFYLGWVVAALNLNFGMIIVYGWGASQKTQLIIFWIVAPLCALGLTALNLYLQGFYGFKSCFALWISVAWAFIGAGINSHRCLTQGCIGPI